MTDPECPVHQSGENCAELHHHLKGKLVSPILEERLAGSLHPGPETIARIRSIFQIVFPPHHGNQKGKDLGRFFHSDLRITKSEPLALSIGVNAPVVFNAFAFKTSGDTCQISVKVQNYTSRSLLTLQLPTTQSICRIWRLQEKVSNMEENCGAIPKMRPACTETLMMIYLGKLVSCQSFNIITLVLLFLILCSLACLQYHSHWLNGQDRKLL